MRFICKAKCWFCYLKNLPEQILSSICPCIENEFETFFQGQTASSFSNEIEPAIFRIEDKLYGDISCVPFSKIINLAKKIENKRKELWLCTSDISDSALVLFKNLRKELGFLRLKLTVHSLDKYCESRNIKEFIDKERLKQNILELRNISERFVAMQVLLPRYFGWNSIRETATFFLDDAKADSLCWFYPYRNHWSEGNTIDYNIEQHKSFSMEFEIKYGLKRFSNPDNVFKCTLLDRSNRIKSIPQE